MDEDDTIAIHLIPRLVTADAPSLDESLATLNITGDTSNTTINPLAVRLFAMLGRWSNVVDADFDVEPMLFERYELIDDGAFPPAAMPVITLVLQGSDIQKQTAEFYTEEAIAGANIALQHILAAAVEQDDVNQNGEGQ
ncbi:hypothetical protein [Bifidobacterium callitrichidarum]|uniref:Uncharacterized protein n=1 Tax=Bifidobacterium callitrichidarum TaxID=2052941 RepID=A0A2U2NC58_9BIFI|nr:hypothetical protein [Bifidobacterium callitrichidarum]PWG66677.1 hypothetical protein DF196_01885 [Bifidobacterium callitrichidarum]